MKFKNLNFLICNLSLCCGISLLFSVAASAANPPEVATYFGNKPPLGHGSVSVLFGKLYDVTIWVKGQRWSWSQPFVLQLRYAKDFSQKQIVDASVDEISKLYNLSDQTQQQYAKIFAGIFPDVQTNDTISAIYFPHQKLKFFHNGRAIGSIQNPQLAKEFLDIWLSNRSRDPELRNRILHIE